MAAMGLMAQTDLSSWNIKMKTLMLLIVIFLVGCNFDIGVPPSSVARVFSGPLATGGDIEQGLFQSGVTITNASVLIIIKDGYATINGESSLLIESNGISWIILDTTSASVGDTFTVSVNNKILSFEVIP